MDFDYSEEQQMLKQSVERLIADRYDFEKRKKYLKEAPGYSTAMWSQYADMGLLGLPFEERYGGSGGGAVETMIVMEAFGRGLILEPYLATVVLGGGLIRLAGDEAQRAAILPKIADGSLLLAFAHSEAQSRYDLADVALHRQARCGRLDPRRRQVLRRARRPGGQGDRFRPHRRRQAQPGRHRALPRGRKGRRRGVPRLPDAGRACVPPRSGYPGSRSAPATCSGTPARQPP
jgi:hypothetical protein